MASFGGQSSDEAFFKQDEAEQAAKAQQSDAAPPSFLQRFGQTYSAVTHQMLDQKLAEVEQFARLGRDVGAGVVTAAANTADTVVKGARESGKGLAMAEDPAHADAAAHGQLPGSELWDHAHAALMDFRDAVAVKDPTLADHIVQGTAQLAIPFMGYSRALAGMQGVAKLFAANAMTDATALAPHDMRMADLFALGRQSETKFGEVLRRIAPDGSALNAYVDYLADRKNESEAEGRFKNVLDGFGINSVSVPLLHAAASVFKYGQSGLRYMMENGVRNTISDLAPPLKVGPAAQRGSVGVQNNASGESAASQEAVNWATANKNAGITFYRLDPEGKPTVLPGIEARDPRAIAGHPVVQLDATGKHEIIERGGLSPAAANGLVERSRQLHDLGKPEEK